MRMETHPGQAEVPGTGKRTRTYQLGLGEVPLPPQVPVHGRKHGQAVVGVHEDVDEAIQGRPEETLATGDPVEDTPPDVEHGCVVVYMQEGDLARLLPQDKEDGVQELYRLGEVIPPQHLGHPNVPLAGTGQVLTL